jgi:hypothetical protein
MAQTPKPSAPVVPLHRLPERERSSTTPFDPNAPTRHRRDDTKPFAIERTSDPDGPPTDRHEIPITIETPAPPSAKSPWDVFPVIPVPAKTSLVSLGDRITAAFVILQGEALEFSPSGKLELEAGHTLEAGSAVNLRLFGEESEEPLSSVHVVAETDLLIYQITLRDLETGDLNLRRKRERYIRTLIMREGEAKHERLKNNLERYKARARELATVLEYRLNEIKSRELRPLKAENTELKTRIAELEPWLETMFQHVPWLLKDREADKESVKQFVELILDERYELYDAIRDDLLILLIDCQRVDPLKSAPLNAGVLRIMAKLDETFKRNMPRVIDPKQKL